MANILQDRKPTAAKWTKLSYVAVGLLGLAYAGLVGRSWHTPAHEGNMTLAQAVDDFDAGHLAPATAAFRTLANQGDPHAADWYGHALVFGLGTPVDSKAALVQYKRAAAGGVVQADVALGELYLNGNAVPPNFVEARSYLTTAAKHGNPRAALDLGRMLQQGIGGPADPVGAYAWLEAASLGGNAQARAERDQLLPSLSPAQQAEAVQQANAIALAAVGSTAGHDAKA
jgi:TPR repeat protein